MKALIYNKMMALAAMLLLAIGVSANTAENNSQASDYNASAVKEYSFAYDVDENTKFDIKNIYGDIIIKNTDAKKISIDVRVESRARNQKDADSGLERVNIDVNKNDNIVKAVTSVESGRNRNRELQINYTVNMPAEMATVLNNKFGDVRIEDLTGDVYLHVEYCTLQAHKIGSNDKQLSKVESNFSTISIADISRCGVGASYSTVDVESASVMALIARYSTVKVKSMKQVTIDAQYSEVNVAKASSAVANLQYGSLKLGSISHKADVDSRYCDVKIKKVENGFKSIKVKSNYADINVEVDSNASYKMSCSASFGGLKVPENTNHKTRYNSSFSSTTSGTVGADSDATIELSVSYGDINLK